MGSKTVHHSPQYICVQVKVYADYTDAAIRIPDLEIGLVAADSTTTSPVSVSTNTEFTGVPFNLPEVGFVNTRRGGDARWATQPSYHKTVSLFLPCCCQGHLMFEMLQHCLYKEMAVTVTA